MAPRILDGTTAERANAPPRVACTPERNGLIGALHGGG